MANSDHVSVSMDERTPLSTTPGSADVQNGTCSRRDAVAARHYKHHRGLAICSIICGNSCLGIKALINSVKAEHTNDPKEAAKYSQLAKKYSIISIVLWIVIVLVIFALLALGSYVLTLIE
ncbi:transmembrane protein 265-like [Betta splendens]|uniref:Transmembrane protein 265-like n=1 Tax=Betta splendens TaxID=158456 RepID=A0A6P7NA36_BETSP|nr:transmembrane protein 265-like [Betta splendens]XP_029015169.1 transmembrane protein 265-like [Betta splendens]